MYYIVNANEEIIAADQAFLDKFSLNNITQIYQKIEQDNISLEYENNILRIMNISSTEEYKAVKTPLYSLLGNLYIIEFNENLENKLKSISDDTDEDMLNNLFDESDIDLNIEEDIIENDVVLVDDSKEESISIEEPQEELLLEDENFLLDNKNEEEILNKEDSSLDANDDEIFDLLLTSDDNAPLISLGNEDVDETSSDTEPIVLDIESLSKTIGISIEDYKSFLNEYKDTALNLESEINGADISKRNAAIETLQHLSSVLHIPYVNEILSKLEKEFDKNLVDDLYNTISRLTTIDSEDKNEVRLEAEQVDTKKDIKLEEPQKSTTSSRHKIDLSNVKPIHFDFSMEQAANELSLPVDLIDEFVHDFIEQAHEETENMLKAYDEGDLDRVNKLGHLLKGTSSNLRITPLADTLYKIQFCESLDELEPLIKDYWGHFLAFEKHIKMRTK